MNIEKNRGVVLIGALVLIIATATDVVTGVSAAIAWAATPVGHAVLLVGACVVLAFLALDRFVPR